MMTRFLFLTVVLSVAAVACAEESEESLANLDPSSNASTTSTLPDAVVATTTERVSDPSTSTVGPTTTALAPTTTELVALAEQTEPSCRRVFDFGDEDASDWAVINDGVMGGQSVGVASIDRGSILFQGVINTNGGGFSSIRGVIDPASLAGTTRLTLRARTDARSYEVQASDAVAGRSRRTSHFAAIEFDEATTDAEGWTLGTVDFAALEARIFGTPVAAEPFSPDDAIEIGVILADGVDGPFELEIDWIDACETPTGSE